MAQARAADAARRAGKKGPLLGIPIAIKNLYDTKDMATTNGSLTFAGFRPARDAFQVARLREAGAVIIGKAGRRISEADSWSHIAGYAPYNDGSVRDWQRHTIQWTAGKNFTKTGGFGPWMVTRDEIADDAELSIETRLNGTVMQHSTTKHMIFSIPVLIKYISTFTSLQPGDVIVTGTPGGVGARREPPVWMKAGDKVEIELSQVGVLVNSIAKE